MNDVNHDKVERWNVKVYIDIDIIEKTRKGLMKWDTNIFLKNKKSDNMVANNIKFLRS